MTESYTTRYTVTISDINYGGHMGNDRPLAIFQDARVQMLDSHDYSEVDIGEGKGIIMVESGVRYAREVFHRDLLLIDIGVTELEKKKFTLSYKVVREHDLKPVFSGFTTFLAFDYSNRSVSRLPEKFMAMLELYQKP